uniref:RxLR effector protein n=1 Tax=Phytophthora agathidicida TaxID=1642459 RepID=A0A7G4WI52_9STRA|nr:PaRXLR63 [Phytophthora agathidicida]
MRLNLVVLVLILVTIFAGRNNATVSFTVKLASPEPPLVTESNEADTSRRSLRANRQLFNTQIKDEEERDITVAQILKSSAQAIRMKAKLNVMLARGLSPTRVLEKLNVARVTDKNFNNFARYYAKYLAKYSNKMPDQPKTAEDFIMLPKLKEWLGQRLLPWQVEHNLKELAARDVNRYIQLYIKDADNAIILPRLQKWMSQKRLPSQFEYNLNELGITDTTRYMQWYMRNGGEDVIYAKLKTWIDKKVLPPKIFEKLKNIGVEDIKTYARIYYNMWGQKQQALSRRNIN